MADALVAPLWECLKKKHSNLGAHEIIKIAIPKFRSMGLVPIIEKGEMRGFFGNKKDDEISDTVELLVKFMEGFGMSASQTADDIMTELDYFGIPWVPDSSGGFMSVRRASELLKDRSAVADVEATSKRQKIKHSDDYEPAEIIESHSSDDITPDRGNRGNHIKKTNVGLYADGASKGRLERLPIESIMKIFDTFKYRVNTEKRNRIGIADCPVKVLIIYSDTPDINPIFNFPAIGILDGDEIEPEWMRAKKCVTTLRYDYAERTFINMTPEVKLRITQLFTDGD